MSPAAVRRTRRQGAANLRLANFYRAKALAALARARHARWIGREGAVAALSPPPFNGGGSQTARHSEPGSEASHEQQHAHCRNARRLL
jgi:hypothetical protein